MVVCAVVFVGVARFAPGTGEWPPDPAAVGRWIALGAITCALWPVLLKRRDLYTSQRRTPLYRFTLNMAGASGIAALATAAAAFALEARVPPSFPLLCALAQGSALSVLRLGLIGGLRLARRTGRNTRNVLVIGSGARAVAVRRSIDANRHWGLHVVRFVDQGDLPLAPEIPVDLFSPLKGLDDVLRDEVVDEVVIAWTRSMFSGLDGVIASCAAAGVPVSVISDFFGDQLPPPEVSYFGPHPALRFAPVHHPASKLAVKRAIDVAGATLGLLLTAGPLLAIACAVRWTSPGPVLFRQVRCGRNGRRFEMLKFRTMYEDAEARKHELAHLNEMRGPVFKLRDDPRVTLVGRFLRRWSLDELPQLWNVLVGDMSLVGPRPPTQDEVSEYEVGHCRRLSMRPGLTCLWQVSGRNTITSFDDWVRMDVEYIDNWSLAGDLVLLLRTVPAVLSGRGAR